jgi:hypothetical protein
LTVDEAKAVELSFKKDHQSQPQVLAIPPSPPITRDPSTLSKKEEIDAEPHILTFAEIKELIETGRLDQIPNNKTIPNALNVRPLLPFSLSAGYGVAYE